MDPYQAKNGVILINDTYNIHLTSVRRALEYVSLYKGRRILVLEPFSELGKNSNKNHIELGKQIGRVCDYLFITNENYHKPLMEGVTQEKSDCVVRIWTPAKIAKFIVGEGKSADVVVFEGREAYNSFSLIASEPVFGL